MFDYILQLLVDISFSWVRMLIALGFSILLGLGLGIWAATSRRAEKVIIPIVDILQTLPILAFFPFVIYISCRNSWIYRNKRGCNILNYNEHVMEHNFWGLRIDKGVAT